MKDIKRFTLSMSCPSDTFKLRRNKDDSNIYKDEEKKLNNSFNDLKSLKDNKYPSNQLSILNNSTSKSSLEQSELENFNIEFFLPNFLKEDIEEIDEENDLNKENSYNNIVELNNKKDNNFKEFNNNFMNDTNTKIEKEKDISKNLHNFTMNSEKSYEKKKNYNSYQNANNVLIGNKNNVNSSNNISIPPQKIITSYNKIFNNTIDSNNNCSSKMNNSDLYKTNFTQNIYQFYNNNIYFLPPNDSNLINEKNCSNYQHYLKENNCNNPINQFSYNVGQVDKLNYDKPLFTLNNKTINNYPKKILDDYTLEMFGRRGWICENCDNFNYESRKKCNRCHIMKIAKKINEKKLISEKKYKIKFKNDWVCIFCGNFNYSFRTVCNRCQQDKMYSEYIS
mgnify:CR=1 FL=1